MSVTALDIVSLDDFKAELRIDPADETQNTLLEAHISAAVDYAQRQTELPLIDRQIIEQVDFPVNGLEPLVVAATDIIEVVSVKYWSADADIGEPPDMTVPANNIGRIQPINLHRTRVWPTGAKWPTTTSAVSKLEVTANVGIAFEQGGAKVIALASLRQAITMMAQKLYDGEQEFMSIDRMLATWKRSD